MTQSAHSTLNEVTLMARDADYLTQRELDLILRGKIPPERTRKAKTNAKRLIIRTMFERWIVFYRMVQRQDVDRYVNGITSISPKFEQFFNPDHSLEHRATLARMNSGDCGTTAIAVGQALELLGFDVKYIDLLDHACIQIDDVYYDALLPNGTIDLTSVLGHNPTLPIEDIGNAELIHTRYLPYDELGVQLVETFVRLLSLSYRYPFKIET